MPASFKKEKAVETGGIPTGEFTINEARFVEKVKKDGSGSYCVLAMVIENPDGIERDCDIFLGMPEDWNILEKGLYCEYVGENAAVKASGGMPANNSVYRLIASVCEIDEDIADAIDDNGINAIAGMRVTFDKMKTYVNKKGEQQYAQIVTEILEGPGGGEEEEKPKKSKSGGKGKKKSEPEDEVDTEELSEKTVVGILEGTKKKRVKISALVGKIATALNDHDNLDDVIQLCDVTSRNGKKFMESEDRPFSVEFDEDGDDGYIVLDQED